MAFRGLFIGLDRYVSRDINWLSCAKRDAVALEALFSDTLGGTTTLLVDEAATRAQIQAEFYHLATCDPHDTIVMGVSRRSAIYHLLRGHVVNGLTRRLPPSCHLLLYN